MTWSRRLKALGSRRLQFKDGGGKARRRPAQVAGLLVLLAAVLSGLVSKAAAAAAAPLTGPLAAADPDRARLARIYERPEFVLARWTEAAADLVRNAFWAFLTRLQLLVQSGNLRPLAWAAAGLLLAFAVGVLIWLTRRLQSAPAVSSGSPRTQSLDVRDLEAEAFRLASAGNWVAAIRRLLRALLVQLDRRGWLPYDPSRSNGEVVRALRRRLGGLGDDLARLLTAADEVTFGGRRGSQPLWQEAEAAYGRLLAALTAEADASAVDRRSGEDPGEGPGEGPGAGPRPGAGVRDPGAESGVRL